MHYTLHSPRICNVGALTKDLTEANDDQLRLWYMRGEDGPDKFGPPDDCTAAAILGAEAAKSTISEIARMRMTGALD